MDKRFISFLVLAMAVMFGWQALMRQFFPPPPPIAQNQVEKPAAPNDAKKPDAAAAPADGKKPEAGAAQPAVPAADVTVEPAFITLGSLDDASPYRMLVTLSNHGAAVDRVELNSPRYHSIDRLHPLGGYLGYLAPKDLQKVDGCAVQVVGPGTPAEKAGLRVGDVIRKVNDDAVINTLAFNERMRGTNPGDVIKLEITRNGTPQTINDVALRQHPLPVVHREASDPTQPETLDPASFLLTLDQLGDKSLDLDKEELPDVRLRDVNWEVLPANPNEAAFRRVLGAQGIEIVKRYTLLTRDPNVQHDTAQPYTLNLKVEVKNIGAEAQRVAYRLDGPTGLPLEGIWYSRASKIGTESNAGMRDVVHGLTVNGRDDDGMTICTSIAGGEAPIIADPLVNYIGVDSQYFAAVVLPQPADPEAPRVPIFSRIKPLVVGTVPEKANFQLADVSFRMVRKPVEMAPGQTAVADEFKIYLGPKSPEMLADYKLQGMVDYGWFDWVAKPMLWILHFFYGLIGNYGIAIILLTVVVRSCMFPLSRKQALNAMKMQELQPEIKRIAEKYKSAPDQRMKAQQELFRKHRYNPFSGCLPIFIQLPIFVGLYNSLRVDVELRQAPLLSEKIRWASDLSAPDMFWFWQPYMPGMLAGDNGWLGPFLNLLPLVTIVLFLVQQKLFMPPPTDEQSALQQKMMKYMMIFMGVMFFKVPAGLCVYFITSSIWSICERMILPKAKPAEPVSQAVINVEPRSSGGDRKAKRR